MVQYADDPVPGACPFINLDDPRCAGHFSLSRVDEAFETCLNKHKSCPTFHQLLSGQSHEQAPIPITIAGRTLADRPLHTTPVEQPKPQEETERQAGRLRRLFHTGT